MATDTELWGTFAVDDHLRRRPFVAEVILFDRLVIPTPPAWTPDGLRDWPVRWKPKALRELLDVLGDRVVPMPWDDAKRKRWEGCFSEYKARVNERLADAQGAAFDVENIRALPADSPAKYLTRVVMRSIVEEADQGLVDRIRALPMLRTTRIETVVAYGAYKDFEGDILTDPPAAAAGASEPEAGGDALLLSWDFLVPEDPDLSDTEVLTKVVKKLDQDKEFAEHRTAFNDLRRRLSRGGADPIAATKEIEKRLVAYNGILRSISRLQTARTVLTYAAIAAPLADFIVPGVGTGTSVALGLASQTWDKWAPNPQPNAQQTAVVMVHDLRQEFAAKPRR